MTTFAGADYSAAREQPNATWLALGRAGHLASAAVDSHILSIYKLEKVGSDRLGAELTGLCGPQMELSAQPGGKHRVLAGLDLPLGFPVDFLRWLKVEKSNDIATFSDRVSPFLAFDSYQELELLAQEFCRGFGPEPKTLAGRLITPRAASPLHRINPGLLKMAWQGRYLQRQLRAGGFAIPPFDGRLDVLLEMHGDLAMEVYPSAMLYAAGLPFRKYKGAAPEARHVRSVIIDKLAKSCAVKAHKVPTGCIVKPTKVLMPPAIAQLALDSDDALDAVLACYSAFVAVLSPFTSDPDIQGADRDTVALEGWIYTPYSF